MLAYRAAALQRLAAGAGRARPWHAMAFYAGSGACAALLLAPDAGWQDRLRHGWGEAWAWLASLGFGLAAWLSWIAPLARRADPTRLLPLVTGSLSAVLAFDLATVACADRLRGSVARAALPAIVSDAQALLERPSSLGALAIVVGLGLCWLLERRRSHVRSAAAPLLGAAVALLGVRIPLGLSAPATLAPADPLVLVLAAASLAAAAFRRLSAWPPRS
jgi:hypothetical protein